MTIVYPLAFPTATGVARIRWTPVPVVAVGQSPFTLSQQVAEWDGQRWEAEVTLPPMTRANAEAWQTFFLKLNGRAGTFLMGPPHASANRGTGGGAPLIKGGSQVGQSILIDGCGNNVSNYLRAGDFLQFGTGATARLHKQLDDANSNSSGEVTLTLWPSVRTAYDDNATVTLVNPQGVFRLAANDQGIDVDAALHHRITFGAVSIP